MVIGVVLVAMKSMGKETRRTHPWRKRTLRQKLEDAFRCVKTCFQTNRQTEPQGSFNSTAVLAAPERERRQAVLSCALAGVSEAVRLSLLLLFDAS